ncbi:MAG: SAM-dependent chlorinase/fluorinase [Solirubrobacteraceae bacterium]
MTAPLITFLSDYGYADEFVGTCHGVIARRCPTARILDLTHGVPRHDIRSGALTLAAALPYTPVGVHLAIVDPGVGGGRRAVALQTRRQSRFLVGPDNGLLALAAAHFGGPRTAIDIGNSSERLQPTSATFHGRDIFAPVAAALADGAQLRKLGSPIDVESLIALALPEPRLDAQVVIAHVLAIDGYGNVSLDATPELAAKVGIVPSADVVVEIDGLDAPARVCGRFSELTPGALLLYSDARGMLALAVNRGSAANQLGVRADHELRLRVR